MVSNAWCVGKDRGRAVEAESESSGPAVFWLQISSFAAYNMLFGYLLARRETSGRQLAFYTAAIGMRSLGNDFGFRPTIESRMIEPHGACSPARRRGMGVGCAYDVHHLGVDALCAFVAGGIVLNVLKQELAKERRSRSWAFATGAAAYGAVLLVTS